MRAALLAALNSVTTESVEQTLRERHGAEMDAITAEAIERLRRLDAEGKLDEATAAIAEAQLVARLAAVGERFAYEFFDALIAGAVAVDEAANG